jgi:hypothetical protein
MMAYRVYSVNDRPFQRTGSTRSSPARPWASSKPTSQANRPYSQDFSSLGQAAIKWTHWHKDRIFCLKYRPVNNDLL